MRSALQSAAQERPASGKNIGVGRQLPRSALSTGFSGKDRNNVMDAGLNLSLRVSTGNNHERSSFRLTGW